MRERPILFGAPMVCAILAGTKTQTRRAVKPQPEVSQEGNLCGAWLNRPLAGLLLPKVADIVMHCPYGKPGDRLWVRETWGDVNLEGAPGIAYRADDDVRDLMAEPSFHDEYGAFNYDDARVKPYDFAVWSSDLIGGAEGRWRPSIHMPRWASRITLEVTAVRVERLQDISEADAIAEGIARDGDGWERFHVDPDAQVGQSFTRNPVLAYRGLWERINGPGSWDINPWVWVIEFRRIDNA